MPRRLQLPKNELSQVEGAVRDGFTALGPRARVRDVVNWMNQERRPQLRWLLEAVAGSDERLRKFVSRRRPNWKAKKEERALEHGVGHFTQRLVQNYKAKNFDAAAVDLFSIGLSGVALLIQGASSAGPRLVPPPKSAVSGSDGSAKKQIIPGQQTPALPPDLIPVPQRTPTLLPTIGERPPPPPPSELEKKVRAPRAPPVS